MKNMLGMLVNLLESLDQIVNEETRAVIRVLKDLFTKLNGREGGTWWEMLKKFLRKEASWVTDSNRALVDTIVTCVVDCTVSFEQMIRAGGYDSVDSRIVSERFPIISKDVSEWEFKLFDFKRSISSESAVAGIVAEDLTNPWQPARTEHMLTYGIYNPGTQLKFPIVGLGSTSEFGDVRGVLCLHGLNPERFLFLRWWTRSGTWGPGFLFLGVRKKLVQVPAA